MLKHSIHALSVGAALALAASGTWAQTSTGSTTSGTATTPSTTVGVDRQDAREATQKAVPRADTGTLVRTEPSAADRASNMAQDAKNAVTPDTRNNNTNTTTGAMNNGNMSNNSGMSNSGNSTGSSMDMNNSTNRTTSGSRAARADRN